MRHNGWFRRALLLAAVLLLLAAVVAASDAQAQPRLFLLRLSSHSSLNDAQSNLTRVLAGNAALQGRLRVQEWPPGSSNPQQYFVIYGPGLVADARALELLAEAQLAGIKPELIEVRTSD